MKFLTTPELQDLIRRVTYKSGWSFEIYEGRHEYQVMSIHIDNLED